MSDIQLKKRILGLLAESDQKPLFALLADIPGRRAVNPLFSGICHANETIHWNAVSAMGTVVSRLADEDMEAARVVMRRFMWSLNDESGGIGWGAPEAMAEIMARHAGLAEEYGHILVACMREDGNFLEHEPLQRGLMWGIGRLASMRIALLMKLDSIRYLLPYLYSGDATVRGLAARTLGLLHAREAASRLRELTADFVHITFQQEGKMISSTVGSLAEEALSLVGATNLSRDKLKPLAK